MNSEVQEFRLVELARRLANVVRPGVIAEADYAASRVRVKYGEGLEEALTEWLPWVTTRAGGDRTWHAPEVGEQVLLLSPSGDLAQAVALPGIYQDSRPAPEASPDKHVTLYSDGTRVEYDRAAHKLKAVLPAGGTAELTAPDGVTITGNVTIAGNVMATGDIDADGNVGSGGDVTADGNIEADGNVEDSKGSMDEMRGVYNTHTHGVPPAPVTPPPNQRMT